MKCSTLQSDDDGDDDLLMLLPLFGSFMLLLCPLRNLSAGDHAWLRQARKLDRPAGFFRSHAGCGTEWERLYCDVHGRRSQRTCWGSLGLLRLAVCFSLTCPPGNFKKNGEPARTHRTCYLNVVILQHGPIYPGIWSGPVYLICCLSYMTNPHSSRRDI